MNDEQTVAQEATPPTLEVLVLNGEDQFTCCDCGVELGGRVATREHLLTVHHGTRYTRIVTGIACGRPAHKRGARH